MPPSARQTNVINDAPTISAVETAETKSEPITNTVIAVPDAQRSAAPAVSDKQLAARALRVEVEVEAGTAMAAAMKNTRQSPRQRDSRDGYQR